LLFRMFTIRFPAMLVMRWFSWDLLAMIIDLQAPTWLVRAWLRPQN
jgi:hypothetical protein